MESKIVVLGREFKLVADAPSEFRMGWGGAWPNEYYWESEDGTITAFYTPAGKGELEPEKDMITENIFDPATDNLKWRSYEVGEWDNN